MDWLDKLGKLVKLELETRYEHVLRLHVEINALLKKEPAPGEQIGYLEVFAEEDRFEERLVLSAMVMFERAIQSKK